MHDDQRTTPDIDRDSSDVVEGPVGSAHLVDPATARGRGADLGDLPDVAGPEGIGDGGEAVVEPGVTSER